MSNIKKQPIFFLTKIFRHIFLSFAGSIVILVFIYSYATIQMQKKSSLEVLHSRANTLANSMALVSHDAMMKGDISFILQYDINVIEHNKEILQIFVTNQTNENIEISKKSWKMIQKIPKNIKDMQKNKEIFKIEYADKFKKNIFHYSYPLNLPGITWGYLHIIYSLDSYNEDLNRMYKSIGTLLGLLFFVTLFISYIVSRELALPILELSKTAESVQKGNLHFRADIKKDDEIGQLAQNFNKMISKLEYSHDELEKLVSIRTEELETLNRELDIKIKNAIAENSKNEQMLIQQSRLAAMGEMIGNIAHQWRQPLNALGLIVQNIYYEYETDDLDKEYLEHSLNKSKKLTSQMSKTIDDFRNFFRPNKKQETFSISQGIHNVFELISASYKSHNIEIETNLDDSLMATGYPNEFSQVLLNILTNAKDALIEKKIMKPKVLVCSFDKDNNIIVEIEDNAGGINENIMKKIFDPYFTTKDKTSGTGIGLYMSKMIIENSMKGKISVHNSLEGAVFRITIKKEVTKDA